MRKNRILRLVSLALVAIMLTCAVGCDISSVFSEIDAATSEPNYLGSKKTDKNAAENVERAESGTDSLGEPMFESALPYGELDFDGEEISILFRNNIRHSREWYKDSPEDELDESIYLRNNEIKQALNVRLVWNGIKSSGSNYDEYNLRLESAVVKDVNNGTHEYDIVASPACSTAQITIRDCAANLLDEELFPYFDFSLPCWNQSIVENTIVNGQLFYVAGDVNLSMLDSACVVWHNRTLYDKKRSEDDPEDLQKSAIRGEWTYDELYRWTSVFYEIEENNNLYALTLDRSASVTNDAFAYAWDLDFIITNSDGTHTTDYMDNSKAENALEMFRSLFNKKGTYDKEGMRRFVKGTSIFCIDKMYSGAGENTSMREMADKYALLPMPKYNLDQDEYATTADDDFTLMLVIDHSDSSVRIKGEAVSAFLQAMNEKTREDVLAYYCMRIVKPKLFGYSSDYYDTMNTIFSIVVDSVKFDYDRIYSPQLGDISHIWRIAANSESNQTVEDVYINNASGYGDTIRELDIWFGIDGNS